MSTAYNFLKREREVVCGISLDIGGDLLWKRGDFLEAARAIWYNDCFGCLLLLALVLGLIYWILDLEKRNQDEDCNKAELNAKMPPGKWGLPLIGETIEFLLDGRKFFRSRRQKYGPVFRSHLCGSPTVVIVGAENVQKVLMADESTLVQSPPSSFLKLFGQNALCSTVGKRHSQLQRSALRLFSPRNISMFVAPIQTVIRDHVTRWRSAAAAGAVVNGVDACREMSLSIIYQCLFGFDLDPADAERITQLFQAFSDGVFAFPLNFPGFAFYKAMKARESLKGIISTRSASGARQTGFLSMLDILQSTEENSQDPDRLEGVPFQEAASDMILELLFGANESSASAMCKALVELAEDETVLGNIRRELAAFDVSPDKTLDYDVIRQLSYTSNVVKEVLRLQPPIAGAFRRTCKPFHIQDYVIPAGWMVLYGITDTHEMSTAFDSVDQFNPDRWNNVRICRSSPNSTSSSSSSSGSAASTTRASTRSDSSDSTASQQQTSSGQQGIRRINRYEYLPFGGGKQRYCVGEALGKTILSLFLVELANCQAGWKLLNGRPEIKTAPIPFPKDNLPLLFHPLQEDSIKNCAP